MPSIRDPTRRSPRVPLRVAALVTSALIAGCGFAGPPAPDTFVVQGVVTNFRPGAIALDVRTADGVLAGAVQPASVPGGPSSTRVIYHVPITGEWQIAINGDAYIESSDFGDEVRRACSLDIVLRADGSSVHGCDVPPEEHRP